MQQGQLRGEGVREGAERRGREGRGRGHNEQEGEAGGEVAGQGDEGQWQTAEASFIPRSINGREENRGGRGGNCSRETGSKMPRQGERGHEEVSSIQEANQGAKRRTGGQQVAAREGQGQSHLKHVEGICDESIEVQRG